MKNYDVIIVGAGPAGCAAAYDLAENGVSVCLLDKAEFPRVKPCAGGFTIKAIKALRFPITDLIQRKCCNCVVTHDGRASKTLKGPYPIAAMTVRSEFDTYHLEQCRKQGADFHKVSGNLEFSMHGDDWLVTSDDQTFRSRYLIGADGAHSNVRKAFNLIPKLKMGFAVETCIPHPEPSTIDMELDFGVVHQGYGWVFPKGDHLNVGLYSLAKIPHAKTRLIKYCQKKFNTEPTESIVGHPIPFNGHTYSHRPGDPLLVGDAAGLIDPLLGEGLYNAIRSGQLAARAILEMKQNQPDPYDVLIKEITKDLKSYRLDTHLFYSNTRLGHWSLTLPPIGFLMMKGYALGKPIRWLKQHLPLIPFLRPPSWQLKE